MFFRKVFKKWLPETLFGRSLIIVIAPVILVQAVTTYVFFDRHWAKVTELLAEGIAGEVGACVELFESSQYDAKTLPAIQSYATAHFGITVNFVDTQFALQSAHPTRYTWRERILYPFLKDQLDLPFEFHIDEQFINVKVALLRGTLDIHVPTKQLFTRTTPLLVWWAMLTPVLFLIIAILFLRNQVKPLSQLAEIVDEFGKGRDVQTLRPRGAAEVRKVACAFNAMKERIHRQITQRQEMLAGVSHDLKTPLTRMELALAIMPDQPELKGLHEDINEMARMIDDYLAFARGQEGEGLESINMNAFLPRLKARLGPDNIHIIKIPPQINILVRPISFQRCLTNLLNNALRYATHAYITVEKHTHHIQVVVEDDGPGIPSHVREEVFKPFYRMENSRNPETGGSGLGLTVAQTIAHNHGGTLQLSSSEHYKGLKAVLTLPL